MWDNFSNASWLVRGCRIFLVAALVLIGAFLSLVDEFGFWLAFLMAIVAPSVVIGVVAFLLELLLRNGDRIRNKKPDELAAELFIWRIGTSGHNVVVEGVVDVNVSYLTIPDVIEGRDVTGIVPNAFANCGRLTEIKAPRGLECVGERAFANCQLLREVKLSKRTVSVGAEAFAGCKSLRTIKFPKTLQRIEPRAFQDCCALDPVVIPVGVREIANDAFPSNVTLKVYKGSAAERWAERMGRNVHLILCAEE